jgi:hypothetical protein
MWVSSFVLVWLDQPFVVRRTLPELSTALQSEAELHETDHIAVVPSMLVRLQALPL